METVDEALLEWMGEPPKGYPELAHLMYKMPQLGIVRSFRELNILNILRMQAELSDLEKELYRIRQADSESDTPRKEYCQHFQTIRLQVGVENSDQHEVFEQIQILLEKYNNAVLQMLQIDQASPPHKRDIKILREWLVRGQEGDRPFLKWPEADLWCLGRGGKGLSDLVSLTSSGMRDPFSASMHGFLLDLYHELWGKKRRKYKHDELIRPYNSKIIDRISDGISIVISSLMPALTILVLYFTKRPLLRIGLMVFFTAIFPLFLRVFTNAQRAQIFSATVAFAAVEVVFVGSVDS